MTPGPNDLLLLSIVSFSEAPDDTADKLAPTRPVMFANRQDRSLREDRHCELTDCPVNVRYVVVASSASLFSGYHRLKVRVTRDAWQTLANGQATMSRELIMSQIAKYAEFC